MVLLLQVIGEVNLLPRQSLHRDNRKAKSNEYSSLVLHCLGGNTCILGIVKVTRDPKKALEEERVATFSYPSRYVSSTPSYKDTHV